MLCYALPRCRGTRNYLISQDGMLHVSEKVEAMQLRELPWGILREDERDEEAQSDTEEVKGEHEDGCSHGSEKDAQTEYNEHHGSHQNLAREAFACGTMNYIEDKGEADWHQKRSWRKGGWRKSGWHRGSWRESSWRERSARSESLPAKKIDKKRPRPPPGPPPPWLQAGAAVQQHLGLRHRRDRRFAIWVCDAADQEARCNLIIAAEADKLVHINCL